MAAAIPFIVAGVSAIGSMQSGAAQGQAAEFNAQVHEQDAIAATKKAKYDEGIHREKVKRLLSEQRAVIGKSGVSIEGTPLLATLDTIEKGELDALAIRMGGDVSALRSRNLATQARLTGGAAQTGSFFKAGTTLLSAGSKALK